MTVRPLSWTKMVKNIVESNVHVVRFTQIHVHLGCVFAVILPRLARIEKWDFWVGIVGHRGHICSKR